tara:strand:- start:144 stop:338 length:195 start_codon:yes stop_codon:yes gene_type:complete
MDKLFNQNFNIIQSLQPEEEDPDTEIIEKESIFNQNSIYKRKKRKLRFNEIFEVKKCNCKKCKK